MQTAIGRRTTAAIALSVAAHLAAAIALGRYSPILQAPQEAAGPPFPVIPLLLMPRTPPPPDGTGQRPAAIRLHQRAPRHPGAPPLPPLKPAEALPVPAATPTPAPAPAPGPPPAAPSQVRAALRGLVGCANPEAARLTAQERDLCDKRLSAGAKTAPWLGMGLDRGKQGALDKAAAANAAEQRARRGPVPVGVVGQGLGGDPLARP